jgi:hypothetical protein
VVIRLPLLPPPQTGELSIFPMTTNTRFSWPPGLCYLHRRPAQLRYGCAFFIGRILTPKPPTKSLVSLHSLAPCPTPLAQKRSWGWRLLTSMTSSTFFPHRRYMDPFPNNTYLWSLLRILGLSLLLYWSVSCSRWPYFGSAISIGSPAFGNVHFGIFGGTRVPTNEIPIP